MKRRPPNLDVPISRRRVLTAQEALLWHSVMTGEALPPVVESFPQSRTKTPMPEPATSKTPPPKSPSAPHVMDSGTRSHIHRGKTLIHATLDLHGHTVDTAHRMLMMFVAQMQGDEVRVVLVITGKGRAPQSGILRAQLPRWLELSPLKEQVSGFGVAGKNHGGDGAWYIKIRKRGKVVP